MDQREVEKIIIDDLNKFLRDSLPVDSAVEDGSSFDRHYLSRPYMDRCYYLKTKNVQWNRWRIRWRMWMEHSELYIQDWLESHDKYVVVHLSDPEYREKILNILLGSQNIEKRY